MTLEFDTSSTAETSGRSRTSRRVVAGVGAAMLVAAAGGVGFGLGQSAGRDDTIDVASVGTDAAPPATEAAPPDQVATTEMVSSDEVVTSDAPSPSLAPSSSDADESSASESADTEEAGAFESSGGGGYSVFGPNEMDTLFERTTDSGVSVRAQLGALWPAEQFFDDGVAGWQPPGWCFQSAEVRVAMSGAGVIDVGSVGWYSEPYEGRSISWLTLGRVDGSPHRVVFTQVPEGTTLVTATFADGSVDAIEPQNGVAVLVVPGAPETVVHDQGQEYGGWIEELPNFDVTFTGASGAAGDITVSDEQVGTWNDPTYVASCSPPPPALPEPGDQPADATEAEAEIIAAMAQLYGGPDEDGQTSLDLLDDATGVAEAREQVAAGGFETEAANAQAIVEELVFTSPTEAWFRYRVETGGIGLNERYGISVLVNGVWLITRDTLCQDLGMAGGSCGGTTRTIRPPGFEYDLYSEDSIIED